MEEETEMKIVIFNWRDIKNPKAGGAEIVTHQYAKGWVKAGHKVSVVCPAFPNFPRKETIDGVEYRRLGIRTSWNYLLIHILAFFYYQRCLKGKIDLVIDQIHWVPFFTPLYVKEKKLAFIHEVAQKIWVKQFGGLIGRIGRKIEPLFFQIYKNIPFLTVSKSSKSDLSRMAIPERNITVIRNGINITPLKKLPKKENVPTFIFVGRIAPVKNIEELIIAFSLIKKELKNAQLWIVGAIDNKDYYNKIRQIVTKNNLKKDVAFFGYVNEKKKFELLRRSHLFLHTSLSEGWGLVVIEANAMGTPAVVYNVAGLNQAVVDDKTGLICRENTPLEMAEHILDLYKDKDKFQRMQKECFVFSGQFSWKKSLSKSEQLINSL